MPTCVFVAPAKTTRHLQERPRPHQCALTLEETYTPQQQHGTRCGTHANHGSACCGCPSPQKRTWLCFLLLFEVTVSEISKVRPRHRVTRLRRTRCVHQKKWSANDSQSVRRRKTRPPVSNCKREVPYCFVYMTVREVQG